MTKILFWTVVFFVILLGLRLLSVAKSKSRDKERPEAPKIPPAEPTVRCVECGVFLPKTEATPVATGYRCNDPACPRRR